MAKDNSQSSSGGWFKSGLFKLNSIFGSTSSAAVTTKSTAPITDQVCIFN